MKKVPGFLQMAVVGLVLMASGCDRAKRVAEKQAFEDLEKSRSELADHLEESLKSDGGSIDPAVLEQQQAKIREAGDRLGGKLGEAMKIAADTGAELNGIGPELDKRVAGFLATLDWESLRLKEDYDDRRKLLGEFKDFNRGVLDLYAGYEAKLDSRLDGIGFRGDDRKEFDAGWKRKFNEVKDLVVIVRTADIECADVALALVDHFEKCGETWQFEDGAVLFEKDEDVETFNGLIGKFEVLGQKQTDAQSKLVELMRN